LKNDRIGVWEHVVPAGSTGHSHTHRRPYISVVVRGGKGETVAPSGEVLDEFEALTSPVALSTASLFDSHPLIFSL
jgi:hypothetical protein